MTTSPWFDVSYYLKAKAAELNAATGSTTWNETSVQDAFSAAGLTAEQHYDLYGWQEGLSPNAYYNENTYLSEKASYLNSIEYAGRTDWTADTFKAYYGENPFHDYIQSGAYEDNVNPSSIFNDDTYYQAKTDSLNQSSAGGRTDWSVDEVKTIFHDSGLTPIGHYLLYGQHEGFYTPEGVTTKATCSINAYMCADNDLEGAGLNDVNEMESAHIGSDITVTYQLDRSTQYTTEDGNWSNTVRGIVEHDDNPFHISSVTIEMSEQNMGSVTTLEDYINWTMSIAKSDVNALILWNHGGGIAGCCWDEGSNDANLSVKDIATAITSSGSGHIELVAFDACLMGILDQAYVLRDCADIMVASEDNIPQDGYDYTGLLNSFSSSSEHTTQKLAEVMVETYDASYTETVTLSAIDLSKLGALLTALHDFDTAWDQSQQAGSVLTTAEHAAQRYDENVDLVDFMEHVADASSSSQLDAAAQAVIAAAEDAVIAACGGADAHGLTIYMPEERDTAYLTDTGADLLAVTGWEDIYTTVWAA